MLVQFEDCIDVLKYLFPDFDFVFFFYNSNGHDQLQSDSLNINKISVWYGENSQIWEIVSFTTNLLGLHHTKYHPVEIGDIQKM